MHSQDQGVVGTTSGLDLEISGLRPTSQVTARINSGVDGGLVMGFNWRPSKGGDEPSGTVAITADGWLLRLYGSADTHPPTPGTWSYRGKICYWEVRSPDSPPGVTGGRSATTAQAKKDVSAALAGARVNRKRLLDPERQRAYAVWRAGVDDWLHGRRSSPNPEPPA
jgi:hypothetical protein